MNRKFMLVGFLFAVFVLVLPSLVAAQVLMRSGSATFAFPNSVVVADFNHDGAMDFAVSSYYTYYGGPGVEVFLGNGDGTFKQPTKYVVTNGAGPLAVGDLNYDGNPDLVASSYGSNAIVVLLGNGDGTFQAPISYATSGAPKSVVLGDFNNDGKIDIATAGSTTVSVIDVLLGNGDGTFQEPAIVTYPPYGGLDALAVGQFTASGNRDLAVAEEEGLSGEVVQILLGKGDGTFSIDASYGVDDAESIVAAGLRSNGQTDLVVAGLISPGPAVLLGNGDGTFEQPVYYHLSTNALSVTAAVGDMNGDGIPDVVSAPTRSVGLISYSAVYIFPGKGDGTFGSPRSPTLWRRIPCRRACYWPTSTATANST